VILNVLKTCQFSQFTVDDASDVNLKTQFAGNRNSNKKAQLTQGLRATAVSVYRHLKFLKFESCAISSAVLENPTLEPNSTSIGKPVAKLWPFLYIQDYRELPSWILSNRK